MNPSYPVHISYEQIIHCVDLSELIHEMEATVRSQQRAAMKIPRREVILSADGTGAFVSMPAYSEDDHLFIVKTGSIVGQSADSTGTTVESLVVAYCGRTGALLGTIDGKAVTNLKCAAVSGLVTKYCTTDKAHTVAIIGSGVQARQQVRAISAVRAIAAMNVASRNPRNARNMVEEIARSCDPPPVLSVCSSIEEAIAGASIIATTTTSEVPVAKFEDTAAGVHINCMGGHTESSREIPAEVLRRAVLIVEDKPTAIAEAGNIHETAVDLEAMMLMTGLDDVMTIFSSTGHAFYDYIATRYILQRSGLLGPNKSST